MPIVCDEWQYTESTVYSVQCTVYSMAPSCSSPGPRSAQCRPCRAAVGVLHGGERCAVALVLLAHLAVEGGGADRRALLSLHSLTGDFRHLVTHLPGDVPALLPLYLVTHLQHTITHLHTTSLSLLTCLGFCSHTSLGTLVQLCLGTFSHFCSASCLGTFLRRIEL